MRIGVSLVLFAVGAILKFAVTKRVNGIDLGVVGIVLMIVAVVGLVISLALLTTRRRTDVVHHRDGVSYVEPTEPVDPRY